MRFVEEMGLRACHYTGINANCDVYEFQLGEDGSCAILLLGLESQLQHQRLIPVKMCGCCQRPSELAERSVHHLEQRGRPLLEALGVRPVLFGDQTFVLEGEDAAGNARDVRHGCSHARPLVLDRDLIGVCGRDIDTRHEQASTDLIFDMRLAAGVETHVGERHRGRQGLPGFQVEVQIPSIPDCVEMRGIVQPLGENKPEWVIPYLSLLDSDGTVVDLELPLKERDALPKGLFAGLQFRLEPAIDSDGYLQRAE